MGRAEGFFMPEIWLSLAVVCAEVNRDVEGKESTCEAVSGGQRVAFMDDRGHGAAFFLCFVTA